MPRLGPLKVHEGKFAGVRMWREAGFENFLIFYRPLKDGTAIERVFHANAGLSARSQVTAKQGHQLGSRNE